MFMPVSTFYQYRYPVDTETAILDFGSTETDFATGQVCYMSCIIFQRQYQCIKIRVFCTPTFYIRKGLFVKGNKITQTTALDRYFILQDCLSGSIFQTICQSRHTSRTSFNRYIKAENSFLILFLIQRRSYFIISYKLAWSTVKIDIPFNTTQPPHILTLQIGTCTPAIHFKCHGIFSFLYIVRDIPFGRSL